MNKNVRQRLVPQSATPQKLDVTNWDVFQAFRRAIGLKRGRPAKSFPLLDAQLIVNRSEHDGVMVSDQRDQLATSFKLQEQFENALGVDTFVDVIAERHERVVWPQINGIDQSGEGDGAAVNVAYRNGSCWHGVILSTLQVHLHGHSSPVGID